MKSNPDEIQVECTISFSHNLTKGNVYTAKPFAEMDGVNRHYCINDDLGNRVFVGSTPEMLKFGWKIIPE